MPRLVGGLANQLFSPSLIKTVTERSSIDKTPRDLVDVIVRYIDVLEDYLAAGAIAAFTAKGVRVRGLSIR